MMAEEKIAFFKAYPDAYKLPATKFLPLYNQFIAEFKQQLAEQQQKNEQLVEQQQEDEQLMTDEKQDDEQLITEKQQNNEQLATANEEAVTG